jgi:dTDP-glucose 4,6-dehydratase
MTTTWLITGGAGFIGSNLVHRLARRHPQVRLVTLDALTYAGNLANLAELENNPHHVFVRGDIADRELVGRLFDEYRFEGVFHLAAESHVDRSIIDPSAFVRTNVEGTFVLLEAARRYWLEGTRRGRFLHVSTDEVFGSLAPDDPPFCETTPYAPSSPYSASKAGSDHLVRAYHHTYGLDTVITNCSNNYGPWQFPEKLIPVMITRAAAGESLPVYGDGMNVRDWLFVEDHCAAIELAFQKGRAGETYCVGGNAEMTNIALVQNICDLVDEALGRQPQGPRRRLITFVKDRPGHDRRYAIDASKITRELGWRPTHTLQDALGETIRWYLAHGEWLEACRSGAYREYWERNYQYR